MRQRIIYYDFIRVSACIMLLIMHAPMPGAAANYGPFVTACSYFNAPGVPLFFMLSGALLLPCMHDRPVYIYVKKCIKRLLIPILVITIFQNVVLYEEMSQKHPLIQRIFSLPVTPQGPGVEWFLYTLMALYLLVPIISPWLRNTSKRSVEMYLILWVISLLIPSFMHLLIRDIGEPQRGFFYYYSGYIGYFLLGYYLREYSISLKVMIPLSLLMLPLPLACKMLGWNVDFYTSFWYLSFPVMIMSATIFLLFKKVLTEKSLPNWICRFVIWFSNLSLGIYLVHLYVMRLWIWKLSIVGNITNYYLQTAIVVVLTLAVSLMICWFISKLPFSYYLIGYKSK